MEEEENEIYENLNDVRIDGQSFFSLNTMEEEENEIYENLNDVRIDMEGEESEGRKESEESEGSSGWLESDSDYDDYLDYESDESIDFTKITDYQDKYNEYYEKNLDTVGPKDFDSLVFTVKKDKDKDKKDKDKDKKEEKKDIDFVLVYDSDQESDERKCFEYWLVEYVKMELQYTTVSNDKLIYVKVHLPQDVLEKTAESLQMKMPLKSIKDKSSEHPSSKDPSRNKKDAQKEPSLLLCKPRNTAVRPFTAPFKKNQSDKFIVKFTTSQRISMAYFFLSHLGIKRLLADEVYKAAYPLHDSNLIKPKKEGDRFLLYQKWAHPKNFFKGLYERQPLDRIRKYYGEKIAIYFAWLGFYTNMLLIASIAGIGCFIYGWQSREKTTWIKEVCNPNIGGAIVMCPQCDRACDYWRLNSTCEASKILSIFDNFGTLVFGGFMTIWVTLFLEFWKRYQAELEYEWDTVDFKEQEEQPRPEYLAKCDHEKTKTTSNPKLDEATENYVAGGEEDNEEDMVPDNEEDIVPYKACGKCVRFSLGIGAILFWVLLILASVVGIVVYRLAVFFVFSTSNSFKGSTAISTLNQFGVSVSPRMTTSITASIVNFIIITILNMLYENVAKWVTDFEIPRTKTDYTNSLTMKMFLFKFVNYYSSCFYIAFVKGKVVGYPGRPVYILGKFRNEECDPEGCLMELTIQLATIMVGGAVLSKIQEGVLVLLSRCKKNSRPDDEVPKVAPRHQVPKVVPRWEEDNKLKSFPEEGLLKEYLEMVIQFGFVTLFVASFPLAPVLALVNNLYEIRHDAWRMTTHYRRMVPEKAQNIGVWLPILQTLGIMSVVTNAMLIAFTSDMIPRLVYYWSFSVYPYGNHSNHTMVGYVQNALSVFDTSHFTDRSRPSNLGYTYPDQYGDTYQYTCRYRDFRYPPGHSSQYEYSNYFWHVVAARLAFVVILEHIAYLTGFVLEIAIPDVPKAIRKSIKKERETIQKVLYKERKKGDVGS